MLTLEEKINNLPRTIRKELNQKILQWREAVKENEIRNDFLSFVKAMWPDFIQGAHHVTVAQKFNELAEGKIKRLIINMPPRHTKSEFASYLLPRLDDWQKSKTQDHSDHAHRRTRHQVWP